MRLADLENEVIEVALRYKGGHARFTGRVRLVGKKVWVGPACLEREIETHYSNFSNMYIVNVGGKNES